MTTPRWQRWSARLLLVTFTTTSFLACGAPDGGTQTTVAQAAPPTTAVMVPPTQPAAPPRPEAQAPPPVVAQATPPPTLPAEAPEQLGKEQMRELVAPVALYPDVVLASLLPATTFPDQVQEAASYVGDAQVIDQIPEDRGWDGSILGVLQFPDVVRWLDDNPTWTDEMGQAVTFQQGDVLEAIQDYRRAVHGAGNLKTNEYQRVTYVEGRDVRIEPAQPDVVYVPSYDPVFAVQPQPVYASPAVNPWIMFGTGAAVGALGAWALYSIFDDDDNYYHRNNYYGGRRIRAYDNYYYSRGRRPRRAEWAARPRPYRRWNRVERPRRLEHRAATGTRRPGRTLRPPTTRPGGPRPGEVRREQQQMRQERRQDNRQQQQMQRQERRDQKQENRGERREDKQLRQQDRKDTRQDRRQQQGQQRQEKRTQRQGNRQQQQNQRQERRQERRAPRQERQIQRQENRQQQQMQRQQQRQQGQAQRQENRQQRQGGGGGGGKKKKQQQQ